VEILELPKCFYYLFQWDFDSEVLLSAMGFNRTCRKESFGVQLLSGASAYGIYTSKRAPSRSQHYSSTSGKVTTGVVFALLGEPWRFLPRAVGKWLSSLRHFLADSECTLAIVNTYTVYLRRVHDRILMDDELAGDHTASDIQAINRCRLYLRVECLSDICTA
jgi:hypothetical protein